MNNNIIIQGDAPPAINYHRIIGEDIDPVPPITYASFICPRGVFKCGDNALCGDCKGFDEHCPNCHRLTAELAITKTALQSGVKMISQLYEDCARLKALLADVWRIWRQDKASHLTMAEGLEQKLEARIKQEGIF